ncbi:MAG: hypothetical protein KIS79_13290, partial [Burkholderiales bacterium]|nr:hypothetical protein [Burkholderiales bacterium]
RMAGEQRIPFFTLLYCPLARAFLSLNTGRPDTAALEFERVTKDWTGAGVHIWVPHILMSHAAALMATGDLRSAMVLLNRATEQIQRPAWNERSSLSEVLRLKGCCLSRSDEADAAAVLFEESLALARAQSARSWELRTAISYARHLVESSDTRKAYAVLRPAYEWFTEGHETKDLREANLLLRQLA